MSEAIELKANIRSVRGKAASRRMRREDQIIPGVVYGGKKEALALSLSHKDTMYALEKEGVFSQILHLDVNGSTESVVIKDLQRHPFKKKILHIDFLRINTDEKLVMNVPVIIEGTDLSPGIKSGGVLSQTTTEVAIQCLPSHLPESIAIDISTLEVGQTIHLSDLVLPKHVEFAHAIEDEEHNHSVCAIHVPKAITEDEPAATESESESEPETKNDD
jgi:large subunit ribosomal protein L25